MAPEVPASDVESLPAPKSVAVYPGEIHGIKLRLSVQEGDQVKRGSVLFTDKRNERMKYCAPAAGTIRSVVRGHRRFVEQIVIDLAPEDAAESFDALSAADLLSADRETIIDLLAGSGYLALIQQRPFSRAADTESKPKSIFVNAMSTGPFRPSPDAVLKDKDAVFQAGLNALTRLTEGKVHLCHNGEGSPCAAIAGAENVEKHTFTGRHPAGNASVHIAAIDPIKPHDVVWAITAADLVLIGELLTSGELPKTRIVSLAGPAVKPESRKHYAVQIGSDLSALVDGRLQDGETRIVAGDVLAGRAIPAEGYLPFLANGFTVLSEGREREFLGWLKPGGRLSYSRTYTTGWDKDADPTWSLTTTMNGGHRAMVLTGYYDRVMPLNILVDYLVRAVLANDTDEAINLGILETDPEDFALCEFICPCKMEIQKIIRKGLDLIEEEGI